ncbi:hypothetical protein [Streptomyces sp. AC555_RSS877]|uniref:hypothetical protein n=1 Tax=Streptomyces sp. AC555_RSS877 TaxID=2823688 RepID=UPI001C253CD1
MTTGWQFRVDRGGTFAAREPVEAVRMGTTVATDALGRPGAAGANGVERAAGSAGGGLAGGDAADVGPAMHSSSQPPAAKATALWRPTPIKQE